MTDKPPSYKRPSFERGTTIDGRPRLFTPSPAPKRRWPRWALRLFAVGVILALALLLALRH